MTWDAVWDVLKWVLLVLAAGFVGQFGKSAAQRLLERKRRRHAEAASQQLLSDEIQADLARVDADAKIEKERAKIEKKRAKGEVKRLKKTDDEPSA